MFLLLAAGLALGACANEPYDAATARADLQAAGLTPEHARCVTSELDDRFASDRLSARATPTDRERERFAEILAECDVTSARGPAS